jgi:hypothetical protein
MCVVGLDECGCDCHGDMDVVHVMPCCAGQCPKCLRYIKLWAWDRHQEGHINKEGYRRERSEDSLFS